MDDTSTTRSTDAARLPSYKLLACAAVAGAMLVAGALRDDHPPQPSPTQPWASSAQSAPDRAPQSTGIEPLPPADPVRLMIPAAGVNAPLTRVELNDAGALRPPPGDEPGLAGWYGDGTAPGQTGTAITVGHVDTPAGPGVFYRLGALTKGDTIDVVREDRRTAVFTVDAVELHAKSDFPDEKVYGEADRPELRVITCGGDYSPSTGYQSNIVVYATLSAVK
ncbi:class F sortase [Streptomyces sp. NPDC018833]|uniref:class F sortase n=1 Tax=Streptomyces sp. NPDC018833 TaxID=3365053 RepID=UPI0037B72885